MCVVGWSSARQGGHESGVTGYLTAIHPVLEARLACLMAEAALGRVTKKLWGAGNIQTPSVQGLSCACLDAAPPIEPEDPRIGLAAMVGRYLGCRMDKSCQVRAACG